RAQGVVRVDERRQTVTSVDPTDARKSTVRRFGRSDRSRIGQQGEGHAGFKSSRLVVGIPVWQQDGHLQLAMPHRRLLQQRLLNGGLMNDPPTALGGTCSGRFDPLRELFKMRRLRACLTVVALAGALPARAEDEPAKSLVITGVTVIDTTGAP